MLYLIIALAIVAGSAIVGLTGAYFIRAKRSEDAGDKPRANIASSAAPQKIEDEVKTIGEQIEKAMSDQRLQGETQRQLLAQKLDSVRQSVETQRHQVEGLRNEFRHESKRRDHEIEQIRTQIGTIQQTVGITSGTPPPAALPPAAEPASASSPEAPPQEADPAPDASAPLVAKFGGSSVALLRLMRLMRVMKLIKKIPQLQMIVMGLVGGLKSIAYIMLLLFLVVMLMPYDLNRDCFITRGMRAKLQ